MNGKEVENTAINTILLVTDTAVQSENVTKGNASSKYLLLYLQLELIK